MIRYDILPTRCGDLLVAINESGLVHVDFVAGLRALPDMSGWQQDHEALAPFLAEFDAYFAGRLQRFSLPLSGWRKGLIDQRFRLPITCISQRLQSKRRRKVSLPILSSSGSALRPGTSFGQRFWL